jgi:hypothetical protein
MAPRVDYDQIHAEAAPKAVPPQAPPELSPFLPARPNFESIAQQFHLFGRIFFTLLTEFTLILRV